MFSLEYANQEIEKQRKQINELWEEIHRLHYEIGVRNGKLETANKLLEMEKKHVARLEKRMEEVYDALEKCSV